MEPKNEQNKQKKQPDIEFQKDVQQGKERMDTEGPGPIKKSEQGKDAHNFRKENQQGKPGYQAPQRHQESRP